MQYTLTIINIRFETKDAVTLCFKQPSLRKIKYQAGQFITLVLRINGRKYARPYSVSSAPSVNATLDITVKRVPGGVVSNYINNEIKVGDIVEVIEPMGDFIYQPEIFEKTIYMWCVGSGITPLYSLAKEILITRSNTKIYLVYGNKNKESTIFFHQLDQLEKSYQSNFKLIRFFSQVENFEENEGFRGRISSEFITSLIRKQKNFIDSVHYICGPKDLKQTIDSSLSDLGIPSSNIFYEAFDLVIDPKELEEVQDSIVSIYFKEKLTEILVPKGKSILDVALDNDIEIRYSCQTGNCNSCRARLIDGQLKMLGLTEKREDLEQDEFLLCCSYPLVSKVSIEVI